MSSGSNHGGDEAARVEDILRELSSEKPGKQRSSIVHDIARLLAYNGVITRGELGELSKGSSVGRQMLSFLKKSGLVFETHSGYILSVPWLVYFYKSRGEGWTERVRRLAPYIREEELNELKELIAKASRSPLGRFVEAYISIMGELQELASIPSNCIPEYCTTSLELCFRELLHYSKWLLLLVAGILELYSKSAKYGEVIEQLNRMGKDFIEFLYNGPERLEKPSVKEEGYMQPSYFNAIVTETAIALKRHATRLYELHRGRRARLLEEAIEWALERYRKANGRNTSRARYYISLLLRETAKAVIADISTRITLS